MSFQSGNWVPFYNQSKQDKTFSLSDFFKNLLSAPDAPSALSLLVAEPKVVWENKTEAFDAVVGGRYQVSTNLGSYACSLPEDPVPGDRIEFEDMLGSFSAANLTIGIGTDIINSSLDPFVAATDWQKVSATYIDPFTGWSIK